jgi:hypothetical protein
VLGRGGGEAITRKKNDGNFVTCAMRNDAVFRYFFFLCDTPGITKQTNKHFVLKIKSLKV